MTAQLYIRHARARDHAQRVEPVARWEGEGGRHEPAREDRPDPVLVLAGLVRPAVMQHPILGPLRVKQIAGVDGATHSVLVLKGAA